MFACHVFHICSFVKCCCQTEKTDGVDEMLQVSSLDITGAASMLSERLGVEVTQECIQDVWAACSWQQKKMSCQEVVLTENSTFVSNLTEAVPLDASQAKMTKEEEMKVCIYPKEEICNIINAILPTPNCSCSLCYRHLRQANCLQLKKH